MKLSAIGTALLLAGSAGVAAAQGYPTKTVRIIVPYPAGGMEAVGGTPDEFVAFLRAETAKWGKLVKSANIKVE